MHRHFSTSQIAKLVVVAVSLAASVSCNQTSDNKTRQGESVTRNAIPEAGAPSPEASSASVRGPAVKTVIEPHFVSPLELKDDVQDKFVRSHVHFALGAFHRFAEHHGDENFVYSPLALQFALGTVVVGARGAGENRLARLAAPGVKPERIYEVMQSWQAQLLRSMSSPLQPGTESVGVLKFGNSLWLDDSLQPSGAFVEKLRQYFGFGVYRISLRSPTNAALGPINQWISDQTEGRIVQLVKALTPAEQTVLTSVAYLKTKFISPFGSVEPAPFAAKNGSKGSVDTMHNTLRTKYVQNLAYQAIEMDLVYGAMSLVAVMPLSGTVSGFVGTLNAQKWDKLLSTLNHSKGTVELYWPKLNLRSHYDKLQTALDLPSGPLAMPYIAANCELSSFVHEAVLVVNQDGIEVPSAAGTTGQGATAPDDKNSDVHMLRFDHPFLFAVIHRLTGSIILAGQVANP